MDRSFEHLAELPRERHPHLGAVDVERLVKVRVELERRARQLEVLIDATQSSPSTPLHEATGPIDAQALLTIPLERSRESFKLGWGAELVARGKHETPQRNFAGHVSDRELKL